MYMGKQRNWKSHNYSIKKNKCKEFTFPGGQTYSCHLI